jgi:dCTP deaminase
MATYPDFVIKQAIEAGQIEIDPYEPANVEPASVDLRLGRSFSTPTTGDVIDTRDPPDEYHREFEADEITLAPGEQILGTTLERVALPNHVEAEVTGRSSLGRLFIEVHKTAGFCDPGFNGQITLEIQNHNPRPVTLYEGQRVCQIIFRELMAEADEPYGHDGSQYQGQTGATPSGMQFE